MPQIPADVIKAAQAAQARYYVPSSVSIAQWAIESSWGQHMPAGSNNPFGIKAVAGQPFVSAMTWEEIGGHNVRMAQHFAKYGSLAEAFEAHARLLATHTTYKAAMDAWYHARDLATGVALMAQHYATDHAYATKIMAIIKSNDLVKYDSLPQDAHKAADPIAAVGHAIDEAVGTVLPSPTPPASAPPPAAPEASPQASADTGTDLMNLLAILEGLFSGVAGKIGVATTVASAVPGIVEGTIANISEAPKAVADIEKLIADIRTGKWSDAPDDIHALVAEFGVILKNYGINLPGLTDMVSALPYTPAITTKS